MKIILNLICTSLLISCSGNKSLAKIYGLEFNKKRKELGLTLLPKNWVHLNSFSDENIQWEHPNLSEKIKGHFKKEVYLINGVFSSESDYYASGKMLTGSDPDDRSLFREKIIIRKTIRNNEVFKVECFYPNSSTPIIDFKTAKIILAEWSSKNE